MTNRRLALLVFALALTVPAATIQAAEPDPKWIGTWVAVWTENQGATELRIDRIESDGTVHGAVCQYGTGRAREIFDIGPTARIQATQRGKTMRFRAPLPGGKQGRPWKWRLGSDNLRLNRRTPSGNISLLFTKWTSKCLDWWQPLTETGEKTAS